MIRFYQISDNYNVLGKTNSRSSLYTVDSPLKKDTNMLKPELIIYSVNSLEIMNYCYISEFSRYYFIEDIKQIRRNLYKLKCRVDVLESYKLQILNANDVEFINSVEVLQSTIHATETPVKSVSYVLSTLGGG